MTSNGKLDLLRAYDRSLEVAGTIADLSTGETIKPEHLVEAIHMQKFE